MGSAATHFRWPLWPKASCSTCGRLIRRLPAMPRAAGCPLRRPARGFVWTGTATSRFSSHRRYRAHGLRWNPPSLANWAQNSILELLINDASSPRIASRSRKSSSGVQRVFVGTAPAMSRILSHWLCRACGLRWNPLPLANWAQNAMPELRIDDAPSPSIASRSRVTSSGVHGVRLSERGLLDRLMTTGASTRAAVAMEAPTGAVMVTGASVRAL